MKKRTAFLAVVFSSSLFLFVESVLADLFYSNCSSIGSPFLFCANHAYVLQSFVITKSGYWFLTPIENFFQMINPATHSGPAYVPLSETMGITAGIGFIGVTASFFFFQSSDSLRRLLNTFAFSCGLYSMMLVGFVFFLPFCLRFQCRVTNYLPWLSYDEAFVISAGFLFTYSLFKLLGWWYPKDSNKPKSIISKK